MKIRPMNKPLKEKHNLEHATEWETNEEPSSMKPYIKKCTNVDENSTSYSIDRIKANAGIRVGQQVDQVQKNLKLGEPHEEVLSTGDSRFNTTMRTRIISSSKWPNAPEVLRRNWCIKNNQVLRPTQLVDDVFRNVHGEIGGHPGITKTKISYRKKYYYANRA